MQCAYHKILIVEGYFSSVIEKNSLSVTYGYNATALVICLFLGTNFTISLPDCTLNILYEIPHQVKLRLTHKQNPLYSWLGDVAEIKGIVEYIHHSFKMIHFTSLLLEHFISAK